MAAIRTGSSGQATIMPSAPAAAIARADEASALRSRASNSATVLVSSAGSRPARSQCRSSTSNLRRTSTTYFCRWLGKTPASLAGGRVVSLLGGSARQAPGDYRVMSRVEYLDLTVGGDVA